jgi:CubicO group peptidase (beta-lactamase class C family)
MDTQAVNAIVQETFRKWGIPGGAIALVQADQVYAQGYGRLAANQPDPVDENSLFAIGSTTKAFTAAAAGLLVDQGKLGWDDPLVKHLPAFALADPWITQNVSLRDLLCHRVGLERAQRLYYHQGYDQNELVRRMRFLRPQAPFRSGFHYANQNYGAVGLAIEAASGQSWDDFIAGSIFRPLGMSRSFSGYDRLDGAGNLAQPHAVLEPAYPAGVRFLGEMQPLPWYKLSHEPAGSIFTSAADLTRWLQMLLNGGAPLLSPAVFNELTSPQVVMQDLEASELAPLYLLQPATHFWTYGLGWWVMDYRGEKVVMHGGQMPGFNSAVAFFPERKIGLAVTINVHQTLAHAALFYALSDLLLDVSERDWNNQFLQVAQGYMAQVKEQVDGLQAARQSSSGPSAPLQDFAGLYENALYGQAQVELVAGQFRLSYGQIHAVLEHWEADTFLARWNLTGLLDDSLVQFGPESLTLLDDQAVYLKQ